MAVVAEIIQAALPSPELVHTGVIPNVAPLGDEGDIAGYSARWRALYPLVDDIDSLEFEFTEGGAPAAVSDVVSEGGGVYLASSRGFDVYPERSYTVRAIAKTVAGYTSVWVWSYSTRRATIAPENLGEISVRAGRATPPGLAEIAANVGAGAIVAASIRVTNGVAGFSGVAHLYALASQATYDIAELTTVTALGGFSCLAHVKPNGLAYTEMPGELFVMTLGGGAFEVARARLTIKKDFADLLALRSEGVGNEKTETASRGESVTAETVSVTLRALRMGQRSITLGSPLAVRVSKVAVYEALRAFGVGEERIQAILRASEYKGGEATRVEVDLVDLILNEGR
jgi:hypothetical protein